MDNNSHSAIVDLDSKVSPVANELWALIGEDRDIAIASASSDDLLIMNEARDRVVVRITATDVEALIPELTKLGFETISSAPELYMIEGYIPLNAIPQLESLDTEGMLGAFPIYQPTTAVGDVTSQADGVHRADRVRAELGIDGTGITVGIMSDSFNNLGGAAEDIASGDLPARGGGVNVLQDLNGGGSDEGRAMAQLIYDLATGSDFAFSSVFFGELDFAQQIRNLANPKLGNSDVLVDDIGYFAEPFFQDGVIAQAIDEVVSDREVTYYSAAGNSADQSYESTNFDVAGDSEGVVTGSFHDFDPGAGIDTRQRITVPALGTIILSLQWDDPFYTTDGVDTDIDIFLLEGGTNNVVAASFDNNLLNQAPVEIVGFENLENSPLELDVVINLFDGPEPEIIKYVNFGNSITFDEFETNSSTISGHPNATNAQAVAAAPFFAPNTPEFFTSIGPNNIFFEPDGTRLPTPEIRQTPDITAVDGTDTTFFGFDFDGNGFPNFFGTSAAAPHAAAISALIQQADSSLSPQEVYDVLAATAIDIGLPGFDNVTGAGLIDAFNAVSSVVPDEPLSFIGDNRNDFFIGGNGDDTLEGRNGRDTLIGGNGDDLLNGENARDLLTGGGGNDTLNGGRREDVLDGNLGNDLLIGGGSNDTLDGGEGDDTLIGGRSLDLITGGAGSDTFQYNDIRDRKDIITDFDPAEDFIDVSNLLNSSSFSSTTPFVDYIELVQMGADTVVKFDTNGDRPKGGNTPIATLENVMIADVTSSNFVFN